MNKHAEFLRTVHDYVAENPDVVGDMAVMMASGAVKARNEALARAADFEAATMLALQPKTKSNRQAILAKLKYHAGHVTALNWASTITKLQEEVTK